MTKPYVDERWPVFSAELMVTFAMMPLLLIFISTVERRLRQPQVSFGYRTRFHQPCRRMLLYHSSIFIVKKVKAWVVDSLSTLFIICFDADPKTNTLGLDPQSIGNFAIHKPYYRRAAESRSHARNLRYLQFSRSNNTAKRLILRTFTIRFPVRH